MQFGHQEIPTQVYKSLRGRGISRWRLNLLEEYPTSDIDDFLNESTLGLGISFGCVVMVCCEVLQSFGRKEKSTLDCSEFNVFLVIMDGFRILRVIEIMLIIDFSGSDLDVRFS